MSGPKRSVVSSCQIRQSASAKNLWNISSYTVTMQLCIRRLTCLAFLAGILVLAESGPNIKLANCCTEVSITNITAPILGYRIQRKQLPCVRAVVFKTAEGEVCSHWKQDWVFEKIKELEQVRRGDNTAAPATTTSQTSSQ